MTTKAKVKQLSKRCDKITRKGELTFLVRHVLQNGKLVNKKGSLLSKSKLLRIKKEDHDMIDREGMLVEVIHY